MAGAVGIYISVPFCRAKCTYCNFASGVFGAERMARYVEQVCAEITRVRARAADAGAQVPELVDTVYLGGGTPSLLEPSQVRALSEALRGEFALEKHSEITLECAPGQLSSETLEEFLRQGMNRVSFGVQSFVDREAKAVGRTHTREVCLAEITRMRAVGLENVNVDLIVGLPHQTAASWRESVVTAVETGAPHISVYMLEVDEDSRLGRELITEGARYGAGAVASEDEIADRYAAGCEWLEAAGVKQYEISNFAREGYRSRHNVKYWRRDAYLGFGLDAHSMLRCGVGGVRWANTDDLDDYLRAERNDHGSLPLLAPRPSIERIGNERALEEALFLGLRMNQGIDLDVLREDFGEGLMRTVLNALDDVEEAGLLLREGNRIRLTAAGRMASNEVFSRVLAAPAL